MDSLSFGSGFALDVRFAVIGNAVLLACAADDKKVHLFAKAGGKFQKTHSISGHEDWIRAMDFCWNGSKIIGILVLSNF